MNKDKENQLKENQLTEISNIKSHIEEGTGMLIRINETLKNELGEIGCQLSGRLDDIATKLEEAGNNIIDEFDTMNTVFAKMGRDITDIYINIDRIDRTLQSVESIDITFKNLVESINNTNEILKEIVKQKECK